MSRLLHPTYKEKIITEARGILNRHHIKMSENQEVINKIYNYVREQIIKNINLGTISCSFNIPNNLYNDSPLTHIKQLKINYNPENNGTKMSVSKLNNIKNGYQLNIYIHLFTEHFKSTFFHEFTHLYQLKKSFRFTVYPNYETVINYFNLNHYTKQQKDIIKQLQEMIYLYNPLELNAIKTDVYTYTYDVASIEDKNNVIQKNKSYNFLLNTFYKQHYLNVDIEEFITKNKNILLPYIWTLTVQSNAAKWEGSSYDLISSRIMRYIEVADIVSEIGESQRPSSKNYGMDIYAEIVKEYPKFLNNSKLINSCIFYLIHGLERQKEDAIKKIKQAMDLAFDDALNQNIETSIYEYVRIKEDIKYGEIRYEINGKTYINELYANSINDIFYKMYVLTLYLKLINLNIKIKFGFKELQEIYSNEWLIKNNDLLNTNIDFSLFFHLQSITDIPDIIELINFEAYN